MKFGWRKVIISADFKDRKIAVSGWMESTDLDLMEYINDFSDHGAKYFVCTDISKDGMMEGPSLELYKDIISNFPDVKLIASGGVTTIEQVMELKEIGCEGAIIGKAIYEGMISIEEVINAVK